MNTPSISPAAVSLNYQGSQVFTASATATTTSYAPCTKYTFNNVNIWYYNNTAYTTEDAYKEAAGNNSSAAVSYTWALSGTGATHLTKADNNATTTVTYSNLNSTGSNKDATLTVTAAAGGANKSATATITVISKTPTSVTFANKNLTVSNGTAFLLPSATIRNAQTGTTITGSLSYTSSNTSVASITSDGKITVNGTGNVTITAAYAGDATYAPSNTTLTFNVETADELNEVVTSDISISPASKTIDLNGSQTFAATDKISKTTRRRSAYNIITVTGGNKVYKQGTTYLAAEPPVNEETADVSYTSYSWSMENDNGYLSLNGSYLTNTNEITATRSASLADAQTNVTLKVVAYYDSYQKTATATITVPANYVDLEGISCEGLTLTYGESGQLVPNTWISTAGAKYVELTYTSADETKATVDANGKVTATGAGSTTITIQSIKQDGTNGVSTTATITIGKVNLEAPSIEISRSGEVTITDNNPGVGATVYYTTDGTDPTSSSSAYSGTFNVESGKTVKAIVIKDNNYNNSSVAAQTYVSSGVSGGVVTLNDLEDHNWTYYAGVDNNLDGGYYNSNYEGKLYSPNPRNVEIIYYGNGKLADLKTDVNGVKVGIDAPQTTFDYYKTIEKVEGAYKYTTIPNPFSVRPKIGNTYYGFSSWRVKSVSGGTITGKAVGSTINAETEITFVPNDADGNGYTPNCTSMKVELEAVWDVAEVSTTGNFSNNYGVERMFYVFTQNQNANITPNSKACTYTSIYPNGTTNGTTPATMNDRKSRYGGFTCAADSKFEYIYLNNNNNSTIVCGNHYLIIGRGVSNSNGTGLSATYIKGLNADVTNLNAKMRIESGFYTRFSALRGYEGSQETPRVTGTMRTEGVLGCDYDRATGDNSKLKVTTHMFYGYITSSNIAAQNTRRETFNYTIKSGDFCSNVNNDIADASESFYISLGGQQANVGRRVLTIEGGQLLSIAGGIDQNNNVEDETVFIRMKGGTLRGSMYGAAAFAATKGHRRMVVTGGTINGWVAAGCNGTDPNQSGGTLPSNTFVYIGGTATIGNTSGEDITINTSAGGNVFGAGSGNASQATTGQVNNSNVVIADECRLTKNVFGGGNYGYASQTARVYVTGGTVDGNVFGGSNQKTGADVRMYMDGGTVKSGFYGGSNITGTVSGSVTMQINGGTVGQSGVTEVNGNRVGIFGGGLGSPTIISQNVDITLGYTDQPAGTGVTVFGDVYGGSALGKVNGTAATNTYHTNVTMNAGTINGSIYGGALGNAGTAANVYGPVAVKVYGGSVKQTSADGSGGVYGANNVNGAPQRSVTVDIYGTDPAPAEGQYALYSVYGGGNKANYTYGNGYPKVTVHNCDNSIEYVYGGGNAAAVAATDVTIYGGDIIGNVFGGGNGTVTAANVTGNATTKIYGGTILNVFGGSNSQGTIGGTISVTAQETAEDGHAQCPINITDLYGGGNKAASAAGNITIGCATHIGAVYGGANQANITGSINLNITAGHIDNVFGGNNTSGSISGGITVTVEDSGESCGMEIGNVFGGGNLAQYSGSPVVKIFNGSVTGNVYGGGKGKSDDHTKGQVTGNPAVTIGDNNSTHQVNIAGAVFGGGDAGNVVGTPVVSVIEKCNTIITTGVYGGGNAADVSATSVTIDGGTIGDVFGGGNGQVAAANVAGNTSVVIHGGSITRAFAGSNTSGTIGGSASITVDHTGSSCDEYISEVYGGGNLAAGAAGEVNIECGAIIGDVYGGANQADVTSDITLNITGGTINRVFGGNNTSGAISGAITVNINKDNSCSKWDVNYVYGAGNAAAYTGSPVVNLTNGTIDNNVYGGGLGAGAVVTGTPQVNLQGATVTGSIFGGGSAANVTGSTDVIIISGTAGNVYGGGESANVSASTDVAVTGGTVSHSVYGGGLGNTTNVAGTATVTLSAGTVTEDVYGGSGFGTVQNTAVTVSGGSVRSVYGGGFGDKANGYEADINGNVAVIINGGTFTGDIFGCNNQNGTPKGTVTVTIDGTMALTLNNVYGGGNLADAGITPNVTVNGCNATITDVYGGGNAAAIAATNVVINGGTISRVFAGGNGAVSAANVAGNTSAVIHGGTIGKAFAGSNTNGSINGKASITVDHDGSSCDESVGEVYGGGNVAAGNAGAVNIECGAIVGDVYGGANEANVTSAITLNITGGTINRVFGGNNTSGTISGDITVNINKAADCNTWDVNYVYGAGNNAPYTGTPTVNLTNGTIDNDVFGGGLGETAIVTGTAVVNLQGASVTGSIFGGGSAANVTGSTDVNITGGKAGYVYGGGKAANVSVNTDVTMTGGTVSHSIYGGGYGNTTMVSGTAAVTLSDGTVTEDIYGGSGFGKVQNTAVTISGGSLRSVYGGGFGDKENNYEADINGNVTLTVNGGTFTGDVFGCNNQNGTPKGTVNIIINGTDALDLNNVYGGGNLADASVTPNVTVNGCLAVIEDIYGGGNAAAVAGTNVTVNGGTINRVFAGGNGQVSAANVTGNSSATIHGGTIGKAFAGSNTNGTIGGTASIAVDHTGACDEKVDEVYGGGNVAAGNAGAVNISCGAVVGDVYGGANQADVTSPITLNITGGTIDRVFGGNNTSGEISGAITVNINKADDCDTWSVGNVYGAGNAAPYTGNPTVNLLKGEVNDSVYGGGFGSSATVTGNPAVILNGGSVSGAIFGGGAKAPVTGNTTVTTESGDAARVYAGGQGETAVVTGNTTAQINGATIAKVFGGGEKAAVSGNVTVNINGGTVTEEVYGGGALANTNTDGSSKTTTVNLTSGTAGDVYGGGLGSADVAAIVNGPVTVTLNGTAVDRVFGCNNVNGTPKDTVNVIVISTTPRAGEHAYHVDAVYGGGNEAEYIPAAHSTFVYIKECDNSIRYVYGGGNAASTPSTHVKVEGGTMEYVFGGGNGERGPEYAANVGYKNDGSTEYGSGIARTEVYGGTIAHLFGGSNSNGNIRSTAVSLIDQPDNKVCETFNIGEVYGAGNEAYMDGTVDLQLGCIPGFDVLYGGAKNADINQDIRLTITSGTFRQIFGGNNMGGTINGSITVNIEETGCNPINITELYGGGNLAAYTVPNDGAMNVNVRSCTSIGTIFGGGLGDADDATKGVITGDTHVNVQMVKGSYAERIGNKLGTIGTIFGGGNIAAVHGDTYVNIATDETTTFDSLTENNVKTVEGANITGNIYGGGSAADVTGKTNVTIGR